MNYHDAMFPKDPMFKQTGPVDIGNQRFPSLHDAYNATATYGSQMPTVPSWQLPNSVGSPLGPVQVTYNAFGQPMADGAFNKNGLQIK